MKNRHKRFVTSVGTLLIALYALASTPAAALVPASAGHCRDIGGNCVGFCDEDMCSIYGCNTACLKGACADGQDSYICQP